MIIGPRSWHAPPFALPPPWPPLPVGAAPRRPDQRPSLLVVDSVSAVLSPILGGRQHNQGAQRGLEWQAPPLGVAASMPCEAAPGDAMLIAPSDMCAPPGRTLVACTYSALARLASRHSVAVLVTNHVVSTGGGGAGDSGQAGKGPRPALGEQWRSLPHTRLMLTKLEGAARRATLVADTTRVSCFGRWHAKCRMEAGERCHGPGMLHPANRGPQPPGWMTSQACGQHVSFSIVPGGCY